MKTRLFALGSGSKGNAFRPEYDGAVLLIDVGFSAKEIRRRAEAIGLPLDTVMGIALTHEHGDHTCGARVLTKSIAAPIVSSPGTWHKYGPSSRTANTSPSAGLDGGTGALRHRSVPDEPRRSRTDGVCDPDAEWRVGRGRLRRRRPTAAMRFLLRHSTALVIEANHDEVMLRTSDYPPSVRQRIAGSAGPPVQPGLSRVAA